MSPLSHRRKIILAAVIVLAIIVIIIIYSLHARKDNNTPTSPAAPTVTTQRLAYTALPLTVTSFGQVVSPVSVTLNAQASGVISSIQFKPGQVVNKGDTLFTLQSNDTTTQLDQLKAQYEIAQQYYERDQQLAKTGAIAEIDLLNAASTYQQDLAQYQEAKAIHTIIAPVNGTISDTPVSVGDFVNSGDTLASIVDPSHFQIKYQLPSQYQQQAQAGQSVTFSSNDTHQTYAATVRYVSPSLSANDYTLTARADFIHTHPALNTFGEVTQVLDPTHQTIAVPQGLVQTDVQGFYVYTLNANHIVAKQYFVPGDLTVSGLITATSGLSPGMDIITSNPSSFNVGETVTVSAS